MKNVREAWKRANELGMEAMDSGDPALAEKHLTDALKHARRLPPGDATLVEALGRLALLRSNVGALDGAETLIREALKLAEGRWDPGHPEVAACRNGLGLVLLDKGEFAAAKKELKLAMLAFMYAPTPLPIFAACLQNLGVVAFAEKRYEHAKSYIEMALGTLLVTNGPQHRDVALALTNLACACQQLGDQEEARELNERAMKIAGTLSFTDPVRALVVANSGRAN